ncbi:serine--tRNA ligase [Rhizosphaericola mali]|uniref:Serine--tRNA ligase n=1 Tax=Rhizosphaericola mali TaxID=2545455 RepID=A0A5P2G6F7_9BACT|nr:serine--tRNA ligase [Rhizosphaericola mali]QES90288.1 serine--tRNA ligase [Rhizosphaericola mali]
MLQVNVLRQNPEWVKERLAVKNFNQGELVDEIIALDDQRKNLQAQFDNAQSKINSASKSIGQMMAQGKKEDAEALKKEVSELKPQLDPIKASMAQVEEDLHNKLVLLPNLPNEKVQPGKSEADNEVVKITDNIPVLPEGALPHWDLLTKYDLIDFELGAKITGSGFPVYKGKGAKLQRALSAYFLDFNTDAGYFEFIPPYMVNETSAYSTGQLPDKEGQMYHATADNFYLIPTAEVPVTNIYRDTILKESDFPVKMTAYSHCFRREAGSFGKEVRGLNRVHEFEKVEIIQIVHPDKSYDVLDEMVAHVEKLIQSLGLPYRILRLCGGDLGFTSAITYDFEVYSEAQGRWLEVSSVSNFETFQANRLKCRFKNEDGKIQLVHTLNGSSLALPRILAAILENYQTEDSIKIPEVLQPYFGAKEIK